MESGTSEPKIVKSAGWWKDPTTITLLVAIVAAVPPLTTGIQAYFHSRNQLALEKSKQLHELRQKYLDRFLSDAENRRVLEFLVAVEEDSRLKAWALAELASTEQRIKTKEQLYRETISVVAKLANQSTSIDAGQPEYKRFWQLYNEALLPVETREVEAVMVQIGRDLRALVQSHKAPDEAFRNLSFTLAATMKRELPGPAIR